MSTKPNWKVLYEKEKAARQTDWIMQGFALDQYIASLESVTSSLKLRRAKIKELLSRSKGEFSK